MLILAGITLSLVLSDGGLIDKSKESIAEHKSAQEKEQGELSEAAGMMKNLIDELGGTGGTTPVTPPTPPTEDDAPLVSTVTSTEHEDNKEVKDGLGNPLVIPSGFKYVTGTNVEDGIVIEDKDGNQFVWIPVSNTDGNGTGKIKTTNKGDIEITLGRYTFATSNPGTPTLIQSGARYAESKATTTIDSYYYENTSDGRPNGGAGAKELDKFVQSVQENHGYYLARYEAGSGTDGKPISKVGAVWTSITQSNASVAAQKMYEGEENYTSDLVNSYAWDTAIVYIQAMGNDNYANAKSPNSSKLNTGATGDEKCHIFDMAGNVYEWTTEYSTSTNGGFDYPCVGRGGIYGGSTYCTALRYVSFGTTGSDYTVGFRSLLYLK